MIDLFSPGRFVGSTNARRAYFHPSFTHPHTLYHARSPAGVRSAAPYTTYRPPREIIPPALEEIPHHRVHHHVAGSLRARGVQLPASPGDVLARLAHLVVKSGAVANDDLLGVELRVSLEHGGDFTRGSDGGDGVGADGFADAEAELPAPARGAVHEDFMPASNAAEGGDGVVRGETLDEETRALLEGPPVWEGSGLVRGGVDDGGVGAEAGDHHDAIAGGVRGNDRSLREIRRGRADGLDHAAEFEARDERDGRGGLVEPEDGEDVREVEADGAHAHANLAGTGGFDLVLDALKATQRARLVHAPGHARGGHDGTLALLGESRPIVGGGGCGRADQIPTGETN